MKYTKKPVVVDAFQWNGDFDALDKWLVSLGEDTSETADDGPAMWPNEDGSLEIGTLEGEVRCQIGGYVIRGVNGEYYPNNDVAFFEANNTPMGEPNRYTKKPVEVEALQIKPENWKELAEKFGLKPCRDHSRSHEAFCDHATEGTGVMWYDGHHPLIYVQVKVEGGILDGVIGDWAITDPKGGTRFCKADIFDKTYEIADAA